MVGCSTVPREDNSSILMEDVIVERTTVRSTTQNPKPKPSGGGVYISGDNINIGTIIVNSPGAVVDNSTKVVVVNQQQINNNSSSSTSKSTSTVSSSKNNDFHHNPPPNQYYDVDANFFKGLDGVVGKLLPSFITSGYRR